MNYLTSREVTLLERRLEFLKKVDEFLQQTFGSPGFEHFSNHKTKFAKEYTDVAADEAFLTALVQVYLANDSGELERALNTGAAALHAIADQAA